MAKAITTEPYKFIIDKRKCFLLKSQPISRKAKNLVFFTAPAGRPRQNVHCIKNSKPINFFSAESLSKYEKNKSQAV